MERMREQRLISRLLLVLSLALASTSAWSHNGTHKTNEDLGKIVFPLSVSNADEAVWSNKTGILVANNGSLPSADLSLTIHMDRVPVNSTVTATVRISNEGPDDAVFSAENNIPIGYRNVHLISHGGALNSNKITWNEIFVASGERTDLTFRVVVNEPSGEVDEYKYVGQITYSDKPDPDSTPNNDDGE